MNKNNRLQFVHVNKIFASAEAAKNYINITTESSRPALFSEPIIARYSGDTEEDIKIILALGARGDGTETAQQKVFFIDSDTLDKNISTVSAETSALSASVTELKSLFDSLKKNAITALNDSETVDFKIISETDSGATYTADVKICEQNDNTLQKLDTDGLYVRSTMSYDSNKNILSYDNGKKAQSFQLQDNRILNRAWYSADTDSIVLEFALISGGTSDVVIPVAGLIHEWDVDNTKHSVKLSVSEQTATATDRLLSADLNIATGAAHNILSIVTDGNGSAAYVDGAADNIFYDETHSVFQKVEAISSATSADIQSLKDKDTALSTKIDEVSGKVASNTENIGNLTTSLNTVKDNLETESDRAKTSESALQNKIESVSSQTTSNTASINALTDSTQNLSTAITQEVSRAKSEETKLDNKITTLDTNVNSVSANVATLNTSIATISTDLTKEVSRATTQETLLQTNIGSETTRATNVENSLATRTTALENGLTASNTEIETVKESVTIEANNRIAKDTELQTNITAEQTRAQIAETNLQTAINDASAKIDTVSGNVKSEEIRAKEAEGTINGRIDRNQLAVEDTLTLDLNLVSASDGRTLKGDVLVNGASENIISVSNAGGLYAKSSYLNYDKGTNILTFTDSKGVQHTFELAGAKVLGTGSHYDEQSKSLVLVFADGTNVTIPLEGLIAEWTVLDTETVDLTLEYDATAGKNILSAKAVLSTNPHNVLTTSGNGLFVSNEANTIIYADGSDKGISVQTALKKLYDDIDAINAQLVTLEGEVIKTLTNEDTDAIVASNTFVAGTLTMKNSLRLSTSDNNVLSVEEGKGLYLNGDLGTW